MRDVPRARVEFHCLLDSLDCRLARACGGRFLLATRREHAEANRRREGAEGEVFAFNGSAKNYARGNLRAILDEDRRETY